MNLEKGDAPFPIADKHFFSHLPLQLSFFALHHIENALDYHLRAYIKYKPQYEEAFLSVVENMVVQVIEQNQINQYIEISSEILKWVTRKREFLELKISSENAVNKIIKEFIKMGANDINKAPKNDSSAEPTEHKRIIHKSKPESGPPKRALKITIKDQSRDSFIKDIFEFITESELDLKAFTIKINLPINGTPAKSKFRIANGQIGDFCRTIRSYYDQKRAFPGVKKNDLARWIVLNFAKQKGIEEQHLSYTTVYNHLRGSKK